MTVQQNGTRAADTVFATGMGTGKFEILSDHIEEQFPVLRLDLAVDTVDMQGELTGHDDASSACAARLTARSVRCLTRCVRYSALAWMSDWGSSRSSASSTASAASASASSDRFVDSTTRGVGPTPPNRNTYTALLTANEGGHHGHRVVAGTASELFKRRACAHPGRESHTNYHFLRLGGVRQETQEVVGSAGLTDVVRGLQGDGTRERRQDGREFGGWVGMGNRATDGASLANWWVGDVGDGLSEQRAVFLYSAVMFEGSLRDKGTNGHPVIVDRQFGQV